MAEIPVESGTENSQGTPARRRLRTLAILAVLLGGGLFLGSGWIIRSRIYITTDNAFVQAPVHVVSSRVAGQVVTVGVEDNQLVKSGDALVRLDPAEFEAAVRKQEALLEQARNQTSGDYAQLAEARAAVRLAEAALAQAQLDRERGAALFARDVLPKEQLDRLVTGERLAVARLQQAREAERRAQAVIGATAGGEEARIAQRRAELNQAQLDLERTRIVSPVDGYVTHKSVEVGNNVRPGQSLMAIVQLDKPWVVANLKETQMKHIHPGETVSLKFDALPGEVLQGEVESIMAGTGAAFSLLPPENATGNYVKIVQRIPVKIRIVSDSPAVSRLRIGMSVVPVIDTGLGIRGALADMNPFE